jgi:hypothetical protein
MWREFEIARPLILGALLEAASHGLRTLSGVRLRRLPRMADFALWATACETTFWPSGTFVRAYDENRKAAIEGAVEADPVADHVREMMDKATIWSEARRTFIGSVPVVRRMDARQVAQVGRNRRGRLPAGYVASRPRFGRSASKSPSVARGEADHPDNGVT